MNQLLDPSTYQDLAVFECGKEECVKSKAISATKKVFHVFHYVFSGKGTLILNKKEYQLGPNTLFLIPEGNDAIYYADKDDPWFYAWVGFDGSKAKDLLDYLEMDVDSPIFIDDNKKLKKYFDNLVFTYLNDGYIDIGAIGCLYEIISYISYKRHQDIGMTPAKVTLQLAKDFIYNNYQFDIGVEDIAKNAHVTSNYLSALFQKKENMSTKQFLIKLRMEKALEFLASGYFNVKQVSEMVGYSNQLHFSAQFKKYYGHSPIKYISSK